MPACYTPDCCMLACSATRACRVTRFREAKGVGWHKEGQLKGGMEKGAHRAGTGPPRGPSSRAERRHDGWRSRAPTQAQAPRAPLPAAPACTACTAILTECHKAGNFAAIGALLPGNCSQTGHCHSHWELAARQQCVGFQRKALASIQAQVGAPGTQACLCLQSMRSLTCVSTQTCPHPPPA